MLNQTWQWKFIGATKCIWTLFPSSMLPMHQYTEQWIADIDSVLAFASSHTSTKPLSINSEKSFQFFFSLSLAHTFVNVEVDGNWKHKIVLANRWKKSTIIKSLTSTAYGVQFGIFCFVERMHKIRSLSLLSSPRSVSMRWPNDDKLCLCFCMFMVFACVWLRSPEKIYFQ